MLTIKVFPAKACEKYLISLINWTNFLQHQKKLFLRKAQKNEINITLRLFDFVYNIHIKSFSLNV